jgi:hypothetical protein
MRWLSDIKNPDLAIAYSKLCSFSVADIDYSWLDTLTIGHYLKQYPINTIKNPFINRIIFNELNISCTEIPKIDQPIDPLFLMERSSLLKLLSLLGSIQFQQCISHTILSKDLANLKNNIGLDQYEFAINFGRLYTLPKLAKKDILEKIFEIDQLRALQCAGAQTLFSAIKKPDNTAFNIIKYKLPTYIAEYLSTDHTCEPQYNVRNKAVKIAKDNAIACYHLLA